MSTRRNVLKKQNKCCVCKSTAYKRCSRCNASNYCSESCQKADWKTHKHTCISPQQSKNDKEHKILGVATLYDMRLYISKLELDDVANYDMSRPCPVIVSYNDVKTVWLHPDLPTVVNKQLIYNKNYKDFITVEKWAERYLFMNKSDRNGIVSDTLRSAGKADWRWIYKAAHFSTTNNYNCLIPGLKLVLNKLAQIPFIAASDYNKLDCFELIQKRIECINEYKLSNEEIIQNNIKKEDYSNIYDFVVSLQSNVIESMIEGDDKNKALQLLRNMFIVDNSHDIVEK